MIFCCSAKKEVKLYVLLVRPHNQRGNIAKAIYPSFFKLPKIKEKKPQRLFSMGHEAVLQSMAGAEGFEPPTNGFGDRRSSR